MIKQESASRPVSLWIVPFLSVIYYFMARYTTGFRGDHLFLVLVVNALYFISPSTRKFITGFSIFVVYWILYDSMKAFPNYNFGTVDIRDLYMYEKKLFGITDNGILLIPSEYFLNHSSVPVDLLSGLFYLCWVPVPLGFAVYLFYTDRYLFIRYSFAFCILNLVGFVVYYLHPAAPPWYVHEYGFEFHPEIKSNAAGLLRVDSILGINLFEGIYSKGSNVFAAMPSLHAAYPMAGLYYGFRQKRKWIPVAFCVVMFGIWFSAVYLSHHYVLDVIAGIVCGLTGILLWEKAILRSAAVKKALFKMKEAIE